MKRILAICALLAFFVACGQENGPEDLPYGEDAEGYVGGSHGDPYDLYGDAELLYTEIAAPPAILLPDDGVLRLHMRPPMTFNPLLNEDITVARILRLVFEPLAVLCDEFRVNGFLADLEFAEDFSGVTAIIREGAVWSDGRPVTADDIISSVEFLRGAPAGAVYRDRVETIADVIRINSRTVEIYFNHASVLAAYSLDFPIIPQHFDGENPVGSGPFAFEPHMTLHGLTLRRNPHARTRAFIEQIEVVFLPNTETDFNAFERGRIDALHIPLTEWTRRHGVRSPVYETFPAMYFEFIGFNFQREIFRNIYTRRGISYAFNADEAVASVFLAYARRAASPVHPGHWAANNAALPDYCPGQAAELLGPVRVDGPLVILANDDNPQRVSIAKRLAVSLTNAGLPAAAKIVPAEEYFARLGAHDFDLFIGGLELPFATDTRVFSQESGLFMHDPVLEAAYENLLEASTEAEFIQAMQLLQIAFTEQLPVIGLAFKHSALLTSPRISSGLNPAPGFVFAGASGWRLAD